MKIGAENKNKLYLMIALLVAAGYMVYSNVLSGPSSTTAPRSGDTAVVVPGPNISRSAGQATALPKVRGKNGEFRPALRAKKPEERIDVANVDPTIRFDQLEKAMAVPPAGGERDLFQILRESAVKDLATAKTKEREAFRIHGPPAPSAPVATEGPVPAPPQDSITLRYYAYTMERPDGKRTAYFLDGEEILRAIEGTTLKGRYRIVAIGLDKVLVEDTVQKRRQSLKIEPEVTG